MLRHQRERLDIEDEPVRCALRPQLRVTFRWQGVVCRIDFDRVELLGVKAQPLYDAATTLTDASGRLWRKPRGTNAGARVVGLSNVSLEQLKEVFESARIKPAVLQVESHPYLPQWELLDYCKSNGIVMQAFAALGHGMEPRLLDDPVITGIAKRVHKTPAQVLLAWAVQRITAPLTTATNARYIEENFQISTLPDDAIKEISEGISTRVRLNPVVDTGIPGFIPRRR